MKFTQSFQDWCIQNKKYLLLHYYQEGDNLLAPDQIGFSSPRTVVFRCHVCELKWERTLNKTTRAPASQSCPYCTRRRPGPFYNLAKEYPELKQQWDYERNASSPEEYLPGSHTAVHWKCGEGHQWTAVIHDRTASADAARRTGRRLCPFCTGRKVSATHNLITDYPEIAREWDYEYNAGMKPEDFHAHSHEKVGWRCSYNPAHRWTAKISNRTSLGRGCRQCARDFKMSYPARVLFYYLRQEFPDCVCEEPFGRYRIDIFLPGIKLAIEHDGYYYHSDEASKRRALKKDNKLRMAGIRVLRVSDSPDLSEPVITGENSITYRFDEQRAYIDHMAAAVFQYLGVGAVKFDHKKDHYEISQLYYHERKKHTLAVEYPLLAREWSPGNSERPDMVFSKSGQSAKWICPDCSQEYEATIINRVAHNSGCSFCANRKVYEKNCLAALYPDIAKEWHPELNGPLTPDDVVPGAEIMVHWKCAKGHVWKALIYSRTGRKGSNCPVCAHRCVHDDISLQTLNPQLAELWHPTMNFPLTPNDVTAKSNRTVMWKCEKGHEWSKSINQIQRINPSRRCPFCSGRMK